MKKRKIPFSVVADLGYFRYRSAKVRNISGTLYYMCKKLTDAEKAQILSYNNTDLFISVCQYAPEIKYNCIFVGNKCF